MNPWPFPQGPVGPYTPPPVEKPVRDPFKPLPAPFLKE
jgi:hypothetical protein